METIKFLPYFHVTDRLPVQLYNMVFLCKQLKGDIPQEQKICHCCYYNKHMISAINSWESLHLNKY